MATPVATASAPENARSPQTQPGSSGTATGSRQPATAQTLQSVIASAVEMGVRTATAGLNSRLSAMEQQVGRLAASTASTGTPPVSNPPSTAGITTVASLPSSAQGERSACNKDADA